MYIFDANVFFTLKNHYRSVFPSIWERLDSLASDGKLISVREVYSEIKNDVSPVTEWAHRHRHIFLNPSDEEFVFMTEIFKHKHFQGLITKGDLNKGRPVADPFVIAAARRCSGTVVTQEKLVENGARIPNVCNRFGIHWINLEQFFLQERLP
ncbi:MAG: PIN domain-containing protein [Elusimicrobiales bacterium]